MFLKKRSKTLMRKACHLFKSLLLLTLKACPLYHLRISHLVILLITLWVFIFSVWPYDLDILPNFLRNQLVPIRWSILQWTLILAPLLLGPFWRLLWILNLLYVSLFPCPWLGYHFPILPECYYDAWQTTGHSGLCYQMHIAYFSSCWRFNTPFSANIPP